MTTIFIAGDSTAASKLPEARPETGWGEAFPRFFQDHVRIENFAINGRSTKSFINEGHLAKIDERIQPGDYFIIQFGHNDQKLDDPNRGTHPFGDYQENLMKFIDVCHKHHAHPLLLTSVTRRQFIKNEIDLLSVGDYPKAMLQFARKHNIPVLDIHKRSREFLNQQGEENSKSYYLHLKPGESDNYPDGIIDDTHFNEKGADAIAQLIIEAIKEAGHPLKELLK